MHSDEREGDTHCEACDDFWSCWRNWAVVVAVSVFIVKNSLAQHLQEIPTYFFRKLASRDQKDGFNNSAKFHHIIYFILLHND